MATAPSAHPPSSPTGGRVGEKGSEASWQHGIEEQPLFQSTTRYCAHTPDPKVRQLARTSWPRFAYNPAMSVFEDPPKRDTQLRVMMTKVEKRNLDKAAKDLDVTVADLVRTAVNKFVEKHKKRKKKTK